MSKRKLSRLLGLVFVLVAAIGGTSAYAFGAEHGPGGTSTVTDADTGVNAPPARPSPPADDDDLYDFLWT